MLQVPDYFQEPLGPYCPHWLGWKSFDVCVWGYEKQAQRVGQSSACGRVPSISSLKLVPIGEPNKFSLVGQGILQNRREGEGKPIQINHLPFFLADVSSTNATMPMSILRAYLQYQSIEDLCQYHRHGFLGQANPLSSFKMTDCLMTSGWL